MKMKCDDSAGSSRLDNKKEKSPNSTAVTPFVLNGVHVCMCMCLYTLECVCQCLEGGKGCASHSE